jgi:two-component system, OmpR family, response regulator
VLIVDDDPDICDLLASYLTKQGIKTYEADCEAALQACVRQSQPDVILLDVNLGSEDGFAIARRLRSVWQGALLMVTGRGDTVDRVVGLELGADDYVTKPFELRELLARVRSVSRRASRESPAITSGDQGVSARSIAFDKFSLSPTSRELRRIDGTLVRLTTGEFDLLLVLAENPGRVLSRDDLLRRTHNRDAAPFDRTIDVQIGRLRKKLDDSGVAPRMIKAVRGAGYVFSVPVNQR